MAAQRPARPARAPARSGGGGNSKAIRASYDAKSGRQQMAEEHSRQDAAREARKAKGFEPFRFWVPADETREIIIVDEEPSFFRYEHNLQDPRTKRFDNFLPCINEVANCPVCSVSDKPAYFAMYLTVIDTTPYVNSDGEEILWSKKMMVVKPAQQKKITRLLEREGTLRGMVLEMTRNGDKDAAIGSDIEFVAWAEEDELAEYYTTYTDKDGKEQEIDGSVPFDYEQIYPDMSEEQLATIAGVSDHSVGNRRQVDRDLGRGGRGGRDAPAGRGRSASRRGEEPEQEEEEEEAPQRGRGGRAAPAGRGRAEAAPRGRAAPAGRGRGRAEPEEPEDNGDEPEEPPQRGRGRATAPAPARGRGRGRAEPEDAPQRAPRGGRRAPASEDPPFEEEEQQEERAPRGSRPAARSAQRARR